MGWGHWPGRSKHFKKWANDKLNDADVDKPRLTAKKRPSLAARRGRKLRRKRMRVKKEE